MELREMKSFYDQKGYVILKNFLDMSEFSTFIQCAEELAEREEKPGNPMKYFEHSSHANAELLNRVENFVDENDGLKSIIRGNKLNAMLENLTLKKQILFKDKINFKLSGGGGFSVHQDAPAFSLFTQQELVVVMVPVDVSTPENGCMQVADNYFNRDLIQHVNGKIPDEKLASIQWKNIEVSPGDVFVFSSFLIHRSADNLSPSPRRCFYLTFNRAEEGNLRQQYFEYKRKNFPPRIERTHESDFSGWKTRLAKTIL